MKTAPTMHQLANQLAEYGLRFDLSDAHLRSKPIYAPIPTRASETSSQGRSDQEMSEIK